MTKRNILLRGVSNNYSFPYAPQARVKSNNDGRDMNGKAYKDVSCKAVQKKYGVASCFSCPLPDCFVTEKDLAG